MKGNCEGKCPLGELKCCYACEKLQECKSNTGLNPCQYKPEDCNKFLEVSEK